MTFEEFQQFVLEHEPYFRGRLPETVDTLAAAEEELGRALPRALKWLLAGYGYWHATGVDCLAESVEATLEARETVRLPDDFVLLNDYGEAGTVTLNYQQLNDEGEPQVYWWMETGDLLEQCRGKDRTDSEELVLYPSFAEFVVQTFTANTFDIPADDVAYNPAEDH